MPPRLEPLPPDQWDQRVKDLLGGGATPGGGTRNVFGTLAHHPDLLRRWLVFGTHVLAKSTLPARDREIAILRVGWLCSSPYEWGQHVVIARAEGITDEEIARIAAGPEAGGWDDATATLLRAVDELHGEQTITDGTWDALRNLYDDKQLLDLVFTVGQYHLVSMALNALHVERDDGVDEASVPFPARS